MIPELEYRGELEGKFCAICKLTFSMGQKILFCPTCESLFHEEHLLDWLLLNTQCPVCERDFSQEIEQYSIRKFHRDSSEGSRERRTEPIRDLTFTNSRPNIRPRVSQFFMILLGVVFGITPFTIIPFVAEIPMAIFVSLVNFIFYIIGMGMIRWGIQITKNKVTNLWNTITFSASGIVIEKLDSTKVEIYPNDILAINVFKTDRRSEDEPTKQLIKLEIITLKDGRLYFGNIFELEKTSLDNRLNNYQRYRTFDSQRDQLYNQLLAHINNHYNIETNLSSKRLKGLIKNPKFLLFSTIGYFVIVTILILINYFVI